MAHVFVFRVVVSKNLISPGIKNSKDLKLKNFFLWTDVLIPGIQTFTIKLQNRILVHFGEGNNISSVFFRKN